MDGQVTQRFTDMQRQIDEGRAATVAASHIAEMAMQTISSHEKLCAERSETIKMTCATASADIKAHSERSTKNFDNIFDKLGKLQILVYIGVGIWVGIPVIAGAIFGVIELIKAFHGQ